MAHNQVAFPKKEDEDESTYKQCCEISHPAGVQGLCPNFFFYQRTSIPFEINSKFSVYPQLDCKII